ncbi:hypothetical protein NQ318_022067 [Aromia moschata]|uniref:Uncharacterized protein n=1 Tax=Aromia moschata TaxID=1265417 RepID=A0AAV8Z5P5_9CUCU|nr:hypothetical protein NQ318_022067 [Aromia moschata]
MQMQQHKVPAGYPEQVQHNHEGSGDDPGELRASANFDEHHHHDYDHFDSDDSVRQYRCALCYRQDRKDVRKSLTSTTTEPSIVPTDENSNYWIVAVPVLIVLGVGCVVFIIILVMCIYKSRRKSSLDISHCHYEPYTTTITTTLLRNRAVTLTVEVTVEH